MSTRETASLRLMGCTGLGVFAVVGLALFALTWRALAAAESEQAYRHQVVAERVFDEMERELSRLLAAEESRSFLQYRPYYAPEGLLPGSSALSASPLSEAPEDPSIAGYFQIDPGGAASTPLSASKKADALARVDEVLEGAALVPVPPPAVVNDALALNNAQVQAPATKSSPKKTETKALAKLEISKKPLPPDDESWSLRSVEQSLNRGAEYRSQRKSVSTKEPAEKVEQFKNEFEPYKQRADSSKEQQSPAAIDKSNAETRPQRLQGSRIVPSEIDVEIMPFEGIISTHTQIVIYRDVSVQAATYRQGLVLRRDALQRHLERIAVTDGALDGLATVTWADPAVGPAYTPATEYSFEHSFAEPFSPLTATLHLSPLPGPNGRGPILGMAALVAATGLIGLVAMLRTAWVTVSFARRRNNFVAAVTHELKTPLTAIRLYAEMLRDGLVPTEERRCEYYETITSETERLTRLIQNVLELARLERGGRPLSASPAPLGPVLDELGRTLGAHAREEGFELLISADAGLPDVLMDHDALIQVLVNLVDNAIKFSRSAADRRVQVLAAPGGAAGVEIRIRDHGPGVPARHLPLIFQAFYRGEHELTRRTQGTGIGLALVSGLVTGMGGRVSARNHPEGGFEVSVCLRGVRQDSEN